MALQRLDEALVARGLCESREKAKRAILAGAVRINDRRAEKASQSVRDSDHLVLQARERYVSRGGHKLEHALNTFALDVRGLSAIDFGASTGGFTDVLLARGARRVYAVDVGHGQLLGTLRQDPRVVNLERTNATDLTCEMVPDAIGVMTIASNPWVTESSICAI